MMSERILPIVILNWIFGVLFAFFTVHCFSAGLFFAKVLVLLPLVYIPIVWMGAYIAQRVIGSFIFPQYDYNAPIATNLFKHKDVNGNAYYNEKPVDDLYDVGSWINIGMIIAFMFLTRWIIVMIG